MRREALALGVHQRLDAVRGPFADQDDAGTADGAEDSVLGAGVDGDRLILGDPAAAKRTQRCAGSTGLVLDLSESGPLSAAGKDQGRGEQTQRDADDQAGDPVLQQEAHKEGRRQRRPGMPAA